MSAVGYQQILITMNMNRTILLLAFALLSAIATSGCITDARPALSDEGLHLVSSLEFVARDSATVALRWKKPHNSEVAFYGYTVRWKSVADDSGLPRDEGSMVVEENPSLEWHEAIVTGLQGRAYVFSVQFMRDIEHGETEVGVIAAVTFTAGPATYFTTDAARPGEEIRLYEPGSIQGNGLILDPEKGGPTRVVPEDAPVQSVALTLELGTDKMWINGPGRNGLLVYEDNYTQVDSRATLHHPWLSDWYSAADEDNYFMDKSEYVIDARAALPLNETPGAFPGYGFTLQLGGVGLPSTRCARIHVKPDETGAYLRGTAPDRYVVLTISLGYPGVQWA